MLRDPNLQEGLVKLKRMADQRSPKHCPAIRKYAEILRWQVSKYPYQGTYAIGIIDGILRDLDVFEYVDNF